MKTITPCRPKWRGTMTDRERFNNQMHYRPVDRCFNMEFGYWAENYRQWSIFVENGITNEREANQQSAPAVERGLFLVPKVIE